MPALYGVGVNPADGTVWGSVLGYPGYVIGRSGSIRKTKLVGNL